MGNKPRRQIQMRSTNKKDTLEHRCHEMVSKGKSLETIRVIVDGVKYDVTIQELK